MVCVYAVCGDARCHRYYYLFHLLFALCPFNIHSIERYMQSAMCCVANFPGKIERAYDQMAFSLGQIL